MNYEQNSANQTAQIGSKPIQIEPELIVLPAAFLLVWHTAGLVAAAIAAALVRFAFWRVSKELQAEQLRAQAAAWANLIGPVVIGSAHPGESAAEVAERAAYFREQLRLSGNPYADKIPIIEMPYTPLLTAHGQLTAGWSIYQKSLGERQHVENLSWYERGCPNELKPLFANAVLPQPKNETI